MNYYQTSKDYDMFKLLNENRNVVENIRLEESIKAHGLLQPIDVDADMYVIDGQHRLAVCKKLGIEVKYRVVDYKRELLFEINNTQRKWVFMDWLSAGEKGRHPDVLALINASPEVLSRANYKYLCVCYSTSTNNIQRSIKNYIGLNDTPKHGTRFNVNKELGDVMYDIVKTCSGLAKKVFTQHQIAALRQLITQNTNISIARLKKILVTEDYYQTNNVGPFVKQIVTLYNKGLQKGRISAIGIGDNN